LEGSGAPDGKSDAPRHDEGLAAPQTAARDGLTFAACLVRSLRLAWRRLELRGVEVRRVELLQLNPAHLVRLAVGLQRDVAGAERTRVRHSEPVADGVTDVVFGALVGRRQLSVNVVPDGPTAVHLDFSNGPLASGHDNVARRGAVLLVDDAFAHHMGGRCANATGKARLTSSGAEQVHLQTRGELLAKSQR